MTGVPVPPREGEIWESQPQFTVMTPVTKLHWPVFDFLIPIIIIIAVMLLSWTCK